MTIENFDSRTYNEENENSIENSQKNKLFNSIKKYLQRKGESSLIIDTENIDSLVFTEKVLNEGETGLFIYLLDGSYKTENQIQEGSYIFNELENGFYAALNEAGEDFQDLKDEMSSIYSFDGEAQDNSQEQEVSQEHNRESQEHNEDEVDEFLKEINSILGDNSINITKENLEELNNITFFGRWCESIVGSEWVNFKFKVDPKNNTFDIYAKGIEHSFEDEGKMISGEKINSKRIKDIKSNFNDNILKFKDINGFNEFSNYIKSELSLGENTDKIKKGLDKWKNLNFEGDKVYDIDKNEIKYISVESSVYNEKTKEEEKHNIAFKVDFKGDKVQVTSARKGLDFNREMSYNDFLIFISEKGLEPLSEENFKNREKSVYNIQEGEDKGPKGGWVSIMDIWNMVKSIPEKMKKDWQEDQEFAAAQLKARLLKGEMGDEAMGELDDKINQRINKEKESFSKSDTEAKEGGIHAKKSADRIKSEVLDKTDIHRKKPLKAMGALLFAVEDGGGLYFRGLAKYSNSGSWVKAVLGPHHQNKFLTEIKDYITMLKNDPENGDLLDKIAKYELLYISDQVGAEKYKYTFGSKMPSKLEGLAYNQFDPSKIDEAKKGEESKNFNEVYNGLVNGYLGNNRPANMLGALKSLTEKCEDESQYYKWYTAMLMPILTGFYKSWGNNFKGEYEKIARKFGVPLGFFVNNFNGAENVVNLFDYISEQKGMDKFSNFINWSSNKNKLFQNGDLFANKDFFNNVERWLKNNSEELTKTLNIKDDKDKIFFMENLSDEKDGDNPTKSKYYQYESVIKDFKEKMFDSGTDFTDVEMESPIFVKEGLYTYGKAFFNRYMLSINTNGAFNDPKTGKMGWKMLQSSLKDLNNRDNIGKEEFEFILKKFKTWFEDTYGEMDINYFIASLGKVDYLKYSVRGMLSKSYYPTIVKDTLALFEDFFRKNSFNIDKNLIKSVFGDNKEKFFNNENNELKKLEDKVEKGQRGGIDDFESLAA